MLSPRRGRYEQEAVSAHISRASAQPCGSEWGGAAPRRNRTTRRSSLPFLFSAALIRR